MKELNSIQNAIFRVGAILFVIGLAIRIFEPTIGTILYSVGIAGFTTMQLLVGYEGSDVTLVRLRRQQMLSDLLFIFSACFMLMQEFRFGPDWGRHNLWVLLLAIGCVLQLYTAYRIPAVMEKNARKNGKTGLGVLMLLPILCNSCATQYNVEGTSTVNQLEGKTLYLKYITDNDDLNTLDSCVVQHGRIHFGGTLDSTKMVNVFMGDQSMMAMVLEAGIISINIGEMQQNVTGTPLNDTLYQFIRAKVKLDDALHDLPRKQSQMVMEGVDENTRDSLLYIEYQTLNAENDKLVSDFIIKNSDNVLGPGIFRIMTSQNNYPYPVLTPQLEEIMFHAKPYFKNHPYVKRYFEAAKQNQERMILGE